MPLQPALTRRNKKPDHLKPAPRKKQSRILTDGEKAEWKTEMGEVAQLPDIGHKPVKQQTLKPTPEENQLLVVSDRQPPVNIPLRKNDLSAMDRRTATRFKRGELPIDATLDLHGATQEEAYSALLNSIRRLSASGKRLLLVITGKGSRSARGEGVLKEQVPKWLAGEPLRPYIVAIATAKAYHGGSGALYVYLKRTRHLA